MLFALLSFSEIWHQVVNNTIPEGVRVRWNMTDNHMEYTHTLLDQSSTDLMNTKEVIVDKKTEPKPEKYNMDEFLKHYHQLSNQMFLGATKEELEAYVKFPEFIENLAYNASELSAGIVMANSQVIDVLINHIEDVPAQQTFRSITQNNHFAQSKIHERYPYLLSHLAELPVTKSSVKMISSYVRGNDEISKSFVNRVGINWILTNIEQNPKLKDSLNCLGSDLGNSIPNQVISSIFKC